MPLLMTYVPADSRLVLTQVYSSKMFKFLFFEVFGLGFFLF